jgi:hypothetical protein
MRDLETQFSTALSAKTSPLLHIKPINPHPNHPKSCIGCGNINCDGLEGIGWVFVSWQLEYLPKTRDLETEFSTALRAKTSPLLHIKPINPHPNNPKSCIGCDKISCDGLEGIGWVFVSWQLEYLPKMRDLETEFSTALRAKTSTLLHIKPINPHPHNPKS